MLLEVKEVYKSYGSTPVIRGLNLSVNAGEFVGVIGPNGAGKTTAFGLIAGHLKCDAGSVWFNGSNVTAAGASVRCKAGMGRTFQIPQPFGGMTTYENALVAACFGASLSTEQAQQLAYESVLRCGLGTVADAPAASLGLLQRKRLELARALATSPKLLLLDEVGGGLTDAEVRQLLELVVEIHLRGVTVLWIEHLVHSLVSVVQRLVVLTDGVVLADGNPQTVMRSNLVRETYLGGELNPQTEAGLAKS
jgi:branched-chain amino acid transport system ATP-binding protein